ISCSSVVKRPFHFIFFPSSTLFRSEYLLDVFRRVGELPGAKDLFAEGKTLVWNLGPGDAARRLRYFFGERDATTGDLVREFSSRSEEHTSELQSRENLVCRLLLEKK